MGIPSPIWSWTNDIIAIKDVETQYMCLYTADGWEGTLDYNCPEGDLEWVLIKELESLNLWEGDRVFFKLLQENRPFFSLKLEYDSDELIKCVLDGKELELTAF